MILRLAIRNLLRHKGRTFATIGVIFFSVAALVFAYGFVAGAGDQMIIQTIRTQHGEVQVYHKDRDGNNNKVDLDHVMRNVDGMLKVVREVPGVLAATPLLGFSAMLNDGVNDLPISVIGIDPETVSDVLRYEDAVREGEPFTAGRDGVWMGRRLAKMFETGVSEYVTIQMRTHFDMIDAVDLEVLGLINTSNPRVDDYQVFVSLSLAQRLVDLVEERGATEILIHSSQKDAGVVAARVADALTHAGYNIRTETWEQAAKALIDGSNGDRVSSMVILGLIMIMGFVGLINTLLIASFERKKEIGTMMALGWRSAMIKRLFVVEGLLTALFAAVPGVILGSGITWKLAQVGISYGISEDEAARLGMPFVGRIYPLFRGDVALTILLITIILGVIASWYPARVASKSDPISSLNAA